MVEWKPVVTWALIILLVFLTVKSLIKIDRYAYKKISTNSSEIPNIFKAKHSVECIPGPGPNADYYTVDNSEGLCDVQNYVHSLSQNYSIDNGIGGSLLD